MAAREINRRDFIKIVGISGTGLCLASFVPSSINAFNTDDDPKIFSPSVYLRIDEQGIVTVIVHRSEMGQGVRTALPMLIAEELEIDWESIKIEQAVGDEKYGSQVTGGSTSIRLNYDPFRKAGAVARTMLITAAANKWNTKVNNCRAEKGFVINKLTDEKISYGELVEAASKLPVPEDVPLKEPGEFKIIGKPKHRLDTPEKIYGQAIFGIDVVIPGMKYAVLTRCPTFGGKVKSFDAAEAKKVNGFIDAFEISNGVAVIAESTWQAFKAKQKLKIEWDLGPNQNVNTESIRNHLKEKLEKVEGIISANGNPDQVAETAGKKIEAIYEVPYITHSPMEPMNCVADVKNGKAELWAPTQSPLWGRRNVAGVLGFGEADVTLNVTYIGGAFGRRLQNDYAVEAAEISAKFCGPVKLTWTREDDTKHSFYRPPSMHKLSGAVDEDGNPVLFQHHVAAPSIGNYLFGQNNPPEKADIAEGTQVFYSIPNIKITGAVADTIVPISWWRSVYHSQNPFATESFIDELAYLANKDPFEFRRYLLPENSRLRTVLEVAAEKSGWKNKLGKGKGKGIACFHCYDSYCAQVAEVTVNGSELIVDKYTIAIDCGVIVNPDTVKAQMESCVAFGLTAAMKSEITIENGGVVESNFDDYPMLTYDEMPEVDVHLIKNVEKVGGIGETGIAACAPALCNAIFAASGKRVRKLPVVL
ncbi:MAG: xanthine dehydrogenase family protein molybdopterin-binding subunit [Ignavibacteria bacterium]|jgi:isoquinoline 1-oxidoreductase beta subunit